MHKFLPKRFCAAVLTVATAISTLFQNSLPVIAESKNTIFCEHDGIQYLFSGSNPDIISVDLSENFGLSEDDIDSALGIESTDYDVYALCPEFYNTDAESIAADGTFDVSLQGDRIRKDGENADLYMLTEDADISDIHEYEAERKQENGDSFWELPKDIATMIVAVHKLQDLSVSLNGVDLSLSGMNADAGISAEDVSKADASFHTLVSIKNMQYAPESIAISGIQEDSSEILMETENGSITLSGQQDGNSCIYEIPEEGKNLLKQQGDAVSFSLSTASENAETPSPNHTVKKVKKTKAQDVASEDTNSTDTEEEQVNEPAKPGSVLLHEGSTTQKEADLGEHEHFLADKYITEQGNIVNGQKTYLTTIEHAAYSNKIIRIKPPKKREILIAIDSSASMGDKVDSMNKAIDEFVETIMEANQERKQHWEEGYYYGTEGDSLENHLLSIRAIIKYNNKVNTLVGSSITPMTQEDVSKITNPAHLRNGYEPNGSLYDMTRTDLALARLKNYIDDPAHSSVILMTDGEPYGRGDEGALDYDTDTSSGLMMTFENTNSALQTARAIKDNGSTLYTVYVQTGYPDHLIDNAKASRNIHQLATMPSQTGGNQILSDQSLGCAFLSMASSDYPKNGFMHGTPAGGDHIFTGSYDDPGEGTFGRYFKMPEEVTKIADNFVDIAKDIDYATSFTDGMSGYAGAASYVYDIVSYPFNVDTNVAITVSKVPRICTGTDAAGKKIFTWGDGEDISTSVSATVENGRYITVRGFDYEANALSDVNKKLKENETESFPSKAGDYGYKLVVQFRIYANRIFGGNGIETNDSSTSGFYPSAPYNKTEWKENTELNPDGTDEIMLYPVPIVDLNIDYKIVSDNVILYAPQTARLSNLVTTKTGGLFATDASYENTKRAYEAAKKTVDASLDQYVKAASDFAKAQGTNDEESKMQALQEAIDAYTDAKTKFAEAQKAYDAVESYIPNGDNNAYVDIHYVLQDPDGNECATMDIPHGVDDTDWHIGWSYKTKDQLVQKHGEYKIIATITPVDTTREESHTGSTAEGTGKPTDFTKTPYAHIYVLQMSAQDSMVESGTAIKLQEDSVIKTDKIQGTSWLKDTMPNGKWVGLDQSTPEENGDLEPSAEGANLAMGTQPGMVLSAPDKTHLKGVNGSFSASGKNGDYIPVTVKMYRQMGDINKDASTLEQTKLQNIPMNDDDELYTGPDGKPVSSVTWKHTCTAVDHCNTTDFPEANNAYNTVDEEFQIKVRYLIHIRQNIVIKPQKRVNGALMKKGSDIAWTISVPNTDAEANPERLLSDSYLVDVLPYNGDGRQDPDTGEDTGSKFTGSLYYKKVFVDFANASSALDALKQGTKGIYYTTDIRVREAEKNGEEIRNTVWTKAEYTLDGTTAVAAIPFDAEALRVDTYLPFGDAITINMIAAMRSAADQKIDDVYINRAYEFTGSDRVGSNATKTKVATSYIAGLVWEDTNGNGMQDSGEPSIKGAHVGLYTTHNAYGGPAASITVDGVQYDKAFDADNNIINDIITGEDGTYRFENLKSGTYFVVAQNIDGKYTITGKNQVSDTNIDSDAEETMPTIDNIGKQNIAASANTTRAWIKDIVVSETDNREHMDLGFLLIAGSIDVTKILDQIYFPSTMTEEEKKTYYPTFHFTLTDASGKKQYKTVQLNKRRMSGACTFTKLPLGTYTLEESPSLNYSLDSIDSNDEIVKDVAGRKVTFTVTAQHQNFSVSFTNHMTGMPPAGDQNQVINRIPMHMPIKLQVHYTGLATISDHTKTAYTFPADQVKETVTYDDGSTAEAVLGETNGYTIDPLTVTNMMNTGQGNRVAIHGFYTEKGVTLEDSFSVAVDLKPLHKFQINFDANGASFDDGAMVNDVMFIYNELSGTNVATNGTYKDISNGLMNGMGDGYTFTGWNTKADGTGIQYDDYAALVAVGKDSGISSITLYANWKVNVTFDANLGTISGGVSEAERELVGKSSGDLAYSVNQTLETALTATREYNIYLSWNTKKDGTGTDLEKYGKITGPVKFYAVYYKTDYGPIEQEDRFVVPMSGRWKLEVWGAYGGGDSSSMDAYGNCENIGNGGYGGYVSGEVRLKAGEVLYVNVGTTGTMYGPKFNLPGNTFDGVPFIPGSPYSYNGGGHSGGTLPASNGQAAGGGATSICMASGLLNDVMNSMVSNYRETGSWDQAEKTILVVAGGGGAGVDTPGYNVRKGEDAHTGGSLKNEMNIVKGIDATYYSNDVVGGGGGIIGGKQYGKAGWNYHSPIMSNVTDGLAIAEHRTPHYNENGFYASSSKYYVSQYGYARITFIGK